MNERGCFIVVEGLEGAGKTTAIATIAEYLQQQGKKVLLTREPGGTHAGETIRNLVKDKDQAPLDCRSELLLMYAARVQLLQELVYPALNRGEWVLADRFEPSTYAYQGGGRGIDKAIIDSLSQICLADFKSDLTFFLDISPKHGLQRAAKRGVADRFEQESIDFFESVYRGYQNYFKDKKNVIRVDAEQSQEAVQKELVRALDSSFAFRDDASRVQSSSS